MLVRARIVLPIAQPPIEDGAVLIQGERIARVGPWSDLASSTTEKAFDLGETLLLPGLVNAHCHLDYTDMAGRIPSPRMFSDWIKAMVTLKSEWSYTDFAQSWVHGAQMLLRTGTTTVLDVEAVPELIPDLWSATPLRVISFRELISLKSSAAGELVENAVADWLALRGSDHAGRRDRSLIGRVGLSPHAPYSTTPDLLRGAAEAARKHRWPLMTHVAESEQEFDMFQHRRGPLFEWLHHQRDMADCGRGSPVQHLERCGCLSGNVIAVHANYLAGEDGAILAKRSVSVAHCPRSHAYFGHRAFPYAELAGLGINLCLGTDSLATVLKPRGQSLELSLFAEMQALAAQHPELAPASILRLATMGGAKALGRPGELGELSEDSLADAIVLPFHGSAAQAEEAALHYAGDVAGAMIHGQWVIPPQGQSGADS